MRAWASVLAVVAGLSAAGPAAAQLPERGAWSLQLSPAENPRVGAWRMASERTNLGVAVGVGVTRSEQEGGDEGTSWSLTVSPPVKRYAPPVGPFPPYLFGSVPLGIQREEFGDDAEGSDCTVGAALAGGLDWFPVRGVSVGGHPGFHVVRNASRSETRFTDLESTSTVLGTFGSGLTLHIYF